MVKLFCIISKGYHWGRCRTKTKSLITENAIPWRCWRSPWREWWLWLWWWRFWGRLFTHLCHTPVCTMQPKSLFKKSWHKKKFVWTICRIMMMMILKMMKMEMKKKQALMSRYLKNVVLYIRLYFFYLHTAKNLDLLNC